MGQLTGHMSVGVTVKIASNDFFVFALTNKHGETPLYIWVILQFLAFNLVCPKFLAATTLHYSARAEVKLNLV